MSCIAAIVSSPVLGSCRSPSLKACTDSTDSSSDIHSSSPLSLRQISLLKSSPPQESLGLSSNAHHLSPSRSSLTTSRLRAVLAVKDENHQPMLWSENTNSPGKHDAGLGSGLWFSQRGRQRLPGRIKVKEEQSESVLTEISASNAQNNSFSAVSPPLKRKRPPKLDIPKSPRDVQMECLHEKTAKEESTSFEGDHYGFYCQKGRKEIMEDTHDVITNILGDSKQAFFGVYDGHGGCKAAAFVAEKLGQNIIDSMVKLGGGDANMENAVKAGYLATDKEFLEKGVSSGACCVTVLVKDGYLVVANAGDCRAVLSRSGNAEALTCDHTAGREEEKKRIENLGGFVDIYHGTWRVQGTLAVSRSIGDLHLKEWVSAEPEIRRLPITWDCDFVILASDGLWEKVSNQEAVDIARCVCVEEPIVSPPEPFEPVEAWNENTSPPPKARKISLGSVPKVMRFRGPNGSFGTMGCHDKDHRDNPQKSKLQQTPVGGPMAACKKLVELAVARGTPDDISVMIVDLRPFCKKKNLDGQVN